MYVGEFFEYQTNAPQKSRVQSVVTVMYARSACQLEQFQIDSFGENVCIVEGYSAVGVRRLCIFLKFYHKNAFICTFNHAVVYDKCVPAFFCSQPNVPSYAFFYVRSYLAKVVYLFHITHFQSTQSMIFYHRQHKKSSIYIIFYLFSAKFVCF